MKREQRGGGEERAGGGGGGGGKKKLEGRGREGVGRLFGAMGW